jgi:1-acyl-sn-glycerol-3-phosphate acyltransferase
MHTTNGDLEIIDAENKLIAIGPHRTGWEAIIVASKMKGTPPQFLATDAYNSIPGVNSFLDIFKTIQVASKARKEEHRSANEDVINQASKVLDDKGCVALFPQGNFARIGQEPPRVYAGAARLAIKNRIPIHVIRLDGFWSLQNPLIPVVIRNNAYYRAFLSALHPNNVRANTFEIDFHLKEENKHLSDEVKIDELCAQLYSYFRHTRELTDKEVGTIKTEIADKTHLLVWGNKLKRDGLEKELVLLKKEQATLEEPVTKSMSLTFQ